MGGILQGQSLYALQATLGALGTAVPQRSPAMVKVGDQSFEAELELGSAYIPALSGGNAAMWILESEGACRLEVRMTLDGERVETLFGKQRSDRKAAPVGALTSDTVEAYGLGKMDIIGVRPVKLAERYADPRSPEGKPRTRVIVGLLPRGLDPSVTPDCGREMLRRSSPTLRAALLASAIPGIVDLATSATVRPRRTFTPWYTRKTWMPFPSDGVAEGLGRACTREERIRLQLRIQKIRAGCNSPDADTARCTQLDHLIERAGDDEKRCLAGEV